MLLQPLPSNPEDGVIAPVSFYPDAGKRVFSMIGTTEGWQVSRVYFRVLATSFLRASEIAQANLPKRRFGLSALEGRR